MRAIGQKRGHSIHRELAGPETDVRGAMDRGPTAVPRVPDAQGLERQRAIEVVDQGQAPVPCRSPSRRKANRALSRSARLIPRCLATSRSGTGSGQLMPCNER